MNPERVTLFKSLVGCGVLITPYKYNQLKGTQIKWWMRFAYPPYRSTGKYASQVGWISEAHPPLKAMQLLCMKSVRVVALRLSRPSRLEWIPAFAGMTSGVFFVPPLLRWNAYRILICFPTKEGKLSRKTMATPLKFYQEFLPIYFSLIFIKAMTINKYKII